ncbi:ExbD/TolR family protein [Fulvivirga imtechensis]|nr:hypothetical protein [Fulvivirga imtechensis]
MHRLLGRKAYHWMGLAALLIIASSFLLTRLHVVDSKTIDEKLIKSSIEYNYDLEIPQSSSYVNLPYNLIPIDLYVGFRKNGDQETVRIIGDYSPGNLNELNLDQVNPYLYREMNRFFSNYQASARLFIDKNVDMHSVYLLSQEIGRTGIYSIFFQTNPLNSSYPALYLPYFDFGLMALPAIDCDCEIDKIDSLMSHGYSSNQIRFPESYCYRMAHINSFNRLKVTIKGDDKLMLNESPITYNKLKEVLYDFENKYYQNALVLLDVNDRSSYGRYIEIMDLIRSSILHKRNALSKQNFNLPYSWSHNLWGEEKKKMQIIEELAPMNIYEMNYTDKYLYDFLKGQ